MAGADKKLVKTKSGLRMVSSNEADTSPFTLAEPPWIPDEECSYCMECQGKFNFTRRKHHCRRCGKCYCASCCKHKVSLPRMCFVDPVILCSSCAQITKKENDFFDKSLKILLTGSHFIVTQDDQENVDTGPVFLCKLSSDNRYLLYEADNVEREAILMDKIQTVQILTSTIEAQGNGNAVGTGIALKYKDELGDLQTVKMVVASGPGRKTGIAFVAAMQKMESMNIDIMGLAEGRWIEAGQIDKEENVMVYSGGEKHVNGVGIILTKKIHNSLMGFWPISDRAIMIKLEGYETTV